jgi:cytochrome c oxidase subunit 3
VTPSQPIDPHALDHHHVKGLAHHFDDMDQQHEAATLGMWAFLATEVLFFGGALAGYAVYRSRYGDAFAAASHHLYLWIGVINTAVLLTSSFMMALAVNAAKQGNRKKIVTFLILTILLGLAFLCIKGIEYYLDYREHLVPGNIFEANWHEIFPHIDGAHPGSMMFLRQVQLFLMFYYILTGIHAVHMIVGISVMIVLAVKASRGRYTAEYNSPIDMAGLYWHFVDVVWIFLLPLLYMVQH